jgi:hypothetical protein
LLWWGGDGLCLFCKRLVINKRCWADALWNQGQHTRRWRRL